MRDQLCPNYLVTKTYMNEMESARLTIGQIREVQTAILDAVVQCCERYGLRYVLAYGTMLGAARHEGYIPWDDDIDLFMPRPDYVRFAALFNRGQQRYRFLSYDLDDRFPYCFAKVEDTGTVLREFTDLPYGMGVNIDIFPVDGAPEDADENLVKTRRMYRRRILLELKRVKCRRGRSLVRNLVLMVGKLFMLAVPTRLLIKKFIEQATADPFDGSVYVADWAFQREGRRFRRELFEETVMMPFENGMYRMPRQYDLMLSMIYGDWRALPPENERRTHHRFDAYGKPPDRS